MLLELGGMSYRSRLDILESFSLEYPRLWGDLIKVYKLRSKVWIDNQNLFLGWKCKRLKGVTLK